MRRFTTVDKRIIFEFYQNYFITIKQFAGWRWSQGNRYRSRSKNHWYVEQLVILNNFTNTWESWNRLFYFFAFAISSFMSASICRGEVIGMNRFTGTPFLSQRNLQKFHFSPWPNIPLGMLALKNLNTGTVFIPFSQSTFPKIGNFAPFDFANSTISAFVPGSCEPKLLQGNASISRSSLYFSYSSRSSS